MLKLEVFSLRHQKCWTEVWRNFEKNEICLLSTSCPLTRQMEKIMSLTLTICFLQWGVRSIFLKLFDNFNLFWADFFPSLQFQSLQIYLFHKDKEVERAWNAKFPKDSWQQQQPAILPGFGKKLARPLLQKAAFKPFALTPHPSKN